MIDLHSHILPGIDDGVRTVEEARALARRAALEGVVAIAATPHVRADWPTTADQMESAVARLRADFAGAGIAVEVLHGGEIAVERVGELTHDELVRFTLAQTGRYLLLEFPYFGSPVALVPVLKALREAGITPLLAHPERNPDVQDNPARLEEAVSLGALVQVTAGSLGGQFGRPARHAAEKLLKLGLVHVLASDVHGPHIREVGLGSAVQAVRDEGLARYLASEAPAAIVAGEPLPRRPDPRRRGFLHR